jgi:hypothetical protein
MKIGLVPMSAKPYHAGHHMLVELAAIAEITDEVRSLELPVNDEVVVFVSFSSRGVRKVKDPSDPRTIKQGARKIEMPKPGETPVFGSDMKYIWNNLLKPNLALPSKVKIISPEDGANAAPVRNIHEVCLALKEAHDAGEESFSVPYSGITANVAETTINIYSDDQDIVTNYSDTLMTQQYGKLWKSQEGPSIQGVGVPRSATVEISGTKMRGYLCDGDLDSFAALLPPLPDNIKKEIASILSNSASCGLPMSRQERKNESLLRHYIRGILVG